jgi:hypothetical protein
VFTGLRRAEDHPIWLADIEPCHHGGAEVGLEPGASNLSPLFARSLLLTIACRTSMSFAAELLPGDILYDAATASTYATKIFRP